MWDGFSGHRKACINVIYTVHVHALWMCLMKPLWLLVCLLCVFVYAYC